MPPFHGRPSAAAAAGIIAGKEELKLEVLSQVTDEEKEKLAAYLKTASIYVRPADSPLYPGRICDREEGRSQAKARIINEHTNIVLLEKDGEVLYQESSPSRQAQICLTTAF